MLFYSEVSKKPRRITHLDIQLQVSGPPWDLASGDLPSIPGSKTCPMQQDTTVQPVSETGELRLCLINFLDETNLDW